MRNKKIAFIGAGNMARSLISGLIANNYAPELIFASDPNSKKLADLQARYDIRVSEYNHDVIAKADVIIFAVKPQVLGVVAKQLANELNRLKPLIISIAAGITTPYICKCLAGSSNIKDELAIVRCMPNMPALIQAGAAALFANSKVSAEQRDLAESIIRSVGITVWLDNEKDMDTVTALSGSGPAYFFLIMEALEKAAVQEGLGKDIAHLLTIQTALGAARLALESQEAISILRENVTSKGGTTEQALKVLESYKLSTILAETIAAAKKRSIELAEILEKE
jgi:pyrroline-5-carboxylate reductase